MIVIDEVSVSAGEVTMLAPVSASVNRGEALTVTGPNGSGKSIHLRVIAGRQKPTSGCVHVHGTEPDERSTYFRRRVPAVLGTVPLARDLTAEEHLRFINTTHGASSTIDEELVDSVMAKLSLSKLRRRFAHELSSGQRQLLMLAMAFVRPGELMIFDEPVRHLDSDHTETLGRLLSAFMAAGGTCVLASHDNDLSRALTGPHVNLAHV